MSRSALIAAVVASASALAYQAGAAPPPSTGCASRALAFSEALEPVAEAVTDGRPERVRAAARGAQRWWVAHRAEFADTAAIAPAMRELAGEAAARRAPLAARAAIRASVAALDGCADHPTAEAYLMRLDLVGMAAWLRAHGINTDFPRESMASANALVAMLRARGQGALADSLAADVAAAMAIPVRVNGPVAAANRLLERVDEVEKVKL